MKRISAQFTKEIIAASVRETMRAHYPQDYSSLCHAFAVVGTNLAAIVLERSFRPVAGLAAIDSGGGTVIAMADDRAFANEQGGAYHCWIESTDHAPGQKELVDLTFGHNHIYARNNGLAWSGVTPPRYLWGPFDKLALCGPLADLPGPIGKDRIWLQETEAGVAWMARHLDSNISGYVELTAAALRAYERRMPAARSALKIPVRRASEHSVAWA